MKKFLEIRNIATKTILMIIGLGLVIAAIWQEVLSGFWLTDKESTGINWGLCGLGFFFATGAAFYNKVADALSTIVSAFIDKFYKK